MHLAVVHLHCQWQCHHNGKDSRALNCQGFLHLFNVSQVEQFEEVERAFVHVDYVRRDGLEHKVRAVMGQQVPSTCESL